MKLSNDLRQSVLQAAIEGKLTKQFEKDGNTEELLVAISKEREELIKEKKIKKSKPLPKISEDEIPFDIPKNWKWTRLRYICTKLVDGDHNPPKGVNKITNYIMASSRNINNNTLVDMNNVRFLSRDVFEKEDQRTQCEKGDIFFTSVGSLGRSCIYDKNINICFQRSVTVIHTKIYNYYLKIVLDSPFIQSKVTSEATGTAQKGFYLNQLEKCLIPVPPLAEQHRIVEKVEQLMDEIDKLEEKENKLEKLKAEFPEDMKESLLQAAMQGKLTEQTESNAKEEYEYITNLHKPIQKCNQTLIFDDFNTDLPRNWCVAELNNIVNFVDYRGKTPHKINSGVFLITASNIKKGHMDYTRKEYISNEEYSERQSRGITHEGDLLFTTEAPLGNAAICDLSECSCGQRIITFQEYEKNTINLKYLMYVLLSPLFQKELKDNCTGTTAKGIKSVKLKHLLIPFPPFEEQERIVAKLDELLPLCEGLKES